MLKRNDKVYYDNGKYCVYVNVRHNIKILVHDENKTIDYFKHCYTNNDFNLPNYVLAKCQELHAMWHNQTIYSWLSNYKKNRSAEK